MSQTEPKYLLIFGKLYTFHMRPATEQEAASYYAALAQNKIDDQIPGAHALRNAGYTYIHELRNMTIDDLCAIKGIGIKTAIAIKQIA